MRSDLFDAEDCDDSYAVEHIVERNLDPESDGLLRSRDPLGALGRFQLALEINDVLERLNALLAEAGSCLTHRPSLRS